MPPKSEKSQAMSDAAKEAAAERAQALATIREQLSALKPLGSVKLADVAGEYSAQSVTLEDLLTELRTTEEGILGRTERPTIKRKTYAQLAGEIRQFRMLPDCDEVSVHAMEHQLGLLAEWERIRLWQEEVAALRKKLVARRDTNRKSYDRSREHERKQGLLRRVLEQRLLAGKAPLTTDPKPSDLVTLEFEVPACAQALLGPPVLLQRRLEKLCGAAVERSPERNRSRTLFLYVLESEQEGVTAFLREADWTGACRTKVDPKVLPQLIGRSGTALRALEDSTNCIIVVSDAEVTVYGRKADAQQVIAHVLAAKTERPSENTTAVIPVDHPDIARALNYSFGRKLRELEKAHNVFIRVVFGSQAASPGAADAVFGADVGAAGDKQQSAAGSPAAAGSAQRPEISVRGSDAAAVAEAKVKVENLVAPLRCLEIPLPGQDAQRRLFSRVSFNGEVDINRMKGGGSSATVGDKFLNLASAELTKVAFLRRGDYVAVVGSAEDIAKVETEAKELITRAGYTSTRIKLLPHHVSVFRRERLSEIEDATGATVAIVRTRNVGSEISTANIEISGDEERKAAAQKMVETILENLHEETVQLNEAETFFKLLQDAATQIKIMQSQFDVKINADKQSKTVQIIGSHKSLANAKAALLALDAELARTITESIPIPDPSYVGRIIGARGATLMEIRQSSGVSTVDIRDSDRKVVIRGTPESVAKAASMIHEILGRDNSSRRQGAGAPPRAASPNGFQGVPGATNRAKPTTVVAQVQNSGVAWGESVVPDNFAEEPTEATASAGSNGAPRGWHAVPAAAASGAAANATPAATSPAGFFPALGEPELGDASKRRARPSKRGGVGRRGMYATAPPQQQAVEAE